MPRFIRKPRKKAGAAPGSLVKSSIATADKSRISTVAYTEDSVDEVDIPDVDSLSLFVKKPGMVWVHIIGIQDTASLSQIGDLFSIHALAIEDIANPGQRPKFEDFDDYFLVVMKQLEYTVKEKQLAANQISLIVGENVLISVQERDDDCLLPVRKRIRSGRGHVRKSGSGYLAYTLIDSIVDHYFNALADLGDDIESLEQEMLVHIDPNHLERIHALKREMLFFRMQVWPVREVVNRLMKSDSPLLPGSTDRFLADVYDHVIHILDTVESFQELLSSMLELYMSTQGNRMNEVMKTLTIIATIFIPLTFLAGIYGMNFKFMPELDWQWGYYGLLGIMFGLGGAMVIYFKRKKWF